MRSFEHASMFFFLLLPHTLGFIESFLFPRIDVYVIFYFISLYIFIFHSLSYTFLSLCVFSMSVFEYMLKFPVFLLKIRSSIYLFFSLSWKKSAPKIINSLLKRACTRTCNDIGLRQKRSKVAGKGRKKARVKFFLRKLSEYYIE